jgi:hypothetical protein
VVGACFEIESEIACSQPLTGAWYFLLELSEWFCNSTLGRWFQSALLLVALYPAWSSEAKRPELVPPTGNYDVGRTSLYWIDLHRDDPLGAKPGTKREFMVIVWYPAETKGPAVRAAWMPERWVSSEANLLCYQRRSSPYPLTMEECQHAIREPLSYSFPNAEMARHSSLWPVLLFVPGCWRESSFLQYFHGRIGESWLCRIRDCADRMGCDCFAGWPQRSAVKQALGRFGMDHRTALPLWANDLRFVLDQIERLNRDPNSIFDHQLDLKKIGAFGHSFGGAAAILAALQDTRILAVLNLDGSPFGVLGNTATIHGN